MNHTIKELSLDNSKQSEKSVQKLKRCLKYTQGTKNYFFVVGEVKEEEREEEHEVIEVWSDSNWAAQGNISGWVISWPGCVLHCREDSKHACAIICRS